ncbi:MAG: DUF1571 domain-containing protein [Candidatus Methylomirabilales bacterium]
MGAGTETVGLGGWGQGWGRTMSGEGKAMARGLVLAGMAAILLVPAPARAREPLALVSRMKAAYARVRDYTAIFKKRERVQGVLLDEEVMQLKFQKPFRVYLRWLDGSKKGREILYVEGENENSMLVHDSSGIQRLFTLLMDPRGKRALRESRFPITDVGIGRLIDQIADGVTHASLRGELQLIDHGGGEEGGRPVWRYELIFPEDPAKGYFFPKLLFAIDRELELPVRLVLHDGDGTVVGDYTYTKLHLNPGLAPLEFDSANPAYRFP